MNNKIFECFESKELQENESFDILEKNVNVSSILDVLLEHPFINSLTYNCNNMNTKLIIYRLNNYYKDSPYIEYFLNNYEITNNESDIYNYLRILPGRKIIKGVVEFDNIIYTIIQVRNNIDIDNWVTLWDIIINKQYYGTNINENIINFFIVNNKIDNLFMRDNLCSKPIVLYCNIDEKYKKYIEKTSKIQYCNNDNNSLIYLNKYKKYDNVRCVCFLDEEELNQSLKHKEHIIERKYKEYYWVFKTDKKIISYIK